MKESTEFRRVTRPPKDNKLPFQVCNFLPILSTRGDQSETLNCFQCNGTPKYIIGKEANVHPNCWAKELAKSSEIFKATSALLSK